MRRLKFIPIFLSVRIVFEFLQLHNDYQVSIFVHPEGVCVFPSVSFQVMFLYITNIVLPDQTSETLMQYFLKLTMLEPPQGLLDTLLDTDTSIKNS